MKSFVTQRIALRAGHAPHHRSPASPIGPSTAGRRPSIDPCDVVYRRGRRRRDEIFAASHRSKRARRFGVPLLLFARLVTAAIIELLRTLDQRMRRHAIATNSAELFEVRVAATLHELAHPREQSFDDVWPDRLIEHGSRSDLRGS